MKKEKGIMQSKPRLDGPLASDPYRSSENALTEWGPDGP